MAASTTAGEALARVERVSNELAQQETERPQPTSKRPAKLPKPKKVH